jgi:hypothetical protein
MRTDELVRPEYVKEATRLLRSSIITVEAEPIKLDDVERTEMPENLGEGPVPQTATLAFEQYMQVSNTLNGHLQEVGSQDLKSLLEWWGDNAPPDLTLTDTIVERVIKRLINTDNVLVQDGDGPISVNPNFTTE